MSDSISESLSPMNVKTRVCLESVRSAKEINQVQDGNLNLASVVLEKIPISEFNQEVQDMASDDGEFDNFLTTTDINNMVLPGSTNALNYANMHMTNQSMMNIPVPVLQLHK